MPDLYIFKTQVGMFDPVALCRNLTIERSISSRVFQRVTREG